MPRGPLLWGGPEKELVGTLKRVELHHHAKFRRNRSNRGRDMAIFSIFQDGGRSDLGF